MRHGKQVELVKAIFRHLDAGTTALAEAPARLPVETYAGEQRLREEIRVLFRRYPLVAALGCQLARAGDFVCTDLAGVPVVVIRGRDGRARGFLNVCRHRGAAVASGEGRVRKVLSCPYHGWSYDLEGRLVHVPQARSFGEIELDALGLTELHTVERAGMVFVHPTPGETFDLDAHLGELAEELDGYGLAGYHYHERRDFDEPMNWKIGIDGFLEPYHFGVLHPTTVAPIFFHNLCLVDGFGPNLREVLPRKTIVALRDSDESSWDLIPHSALVYVLFPNTVFVMQLDHVELWRMYPDAERPGRCRMTMDFLVPERAQTNSARGHWDRNMKLVTDTVRDEDFPVGASIQAGLGSGAQSFLTVGRNEPAVAHFERAVAAALDAHRKPA